MKRSINRILTTHVGSLPRPNDLVGGYRDNAPESKLLPRLRSAIADVVRRQSDSGIDVVNDGEYGKAMRRSVDFGAWWSYVYDRLAGSSSERRRRRKGVPRGRSAARNAKNLPNSTPRKPAPVKAAPAAPPAAAARGYQQRPHVRAHLHRSGRNIPVSQSSNTISRTSRRRSAKCLGRRGFPDSGIAGDTANPARMSVTKAKKTILGH